MKVKMSSLHKLYGNARGGQSGITGLETALSGLESATNTLEPKGAIIAEESTITADTIDNIQFKMTNSAGADFVGLRPSRTLVTYSGESNFINAVYTGTGNGINGVATAPQAFTTAGFPRPLNTVGWGHDWILGTGDNVDPGEIVEFTLNVRQIGVGANTPFKIEVIPGQGAVITIERTTPLEIQAFNDLD